MKEILLTKIGSTFMAISTLIVASCSAPESTEPVKKRPLNGQAIQPPTVDDSVTGAQDQVFGGGESSDIGTLGDGSETTDDLNGNDSDNGNQLTFNADFVYACYNAEKFCKFNQEAQSGIDIIWLEASQNYVLDTTPNRFDVVVKVALVEDTDFRAEVVGKDNKVLISASGSGEPGEQPLINFLNFSYSALKDQPMGQIPDGTGKKHPWYELVIKADNQVKKSRLVIKYPEDPPT